MPLWVEISPLMSYIGIESLKLRVVSPKYMRTFEFRNSGLQTFHNFLMSVLVMPKYEITSQAHINAWG